MIETIQPGWDAPRGISACCTTRPAGVSAAPFDSFNLALHVGDDESLVRQNRDLLRQSLSLPAEPCWLNQTHGVQVATLEQDATRDVDAAVTRRRGTVAVVMTADCLPILLCNRNGDEVAAVHAGWRGLQAGVIQATLASMKSAYNQLLAWVGPGISQSCFEVGEEVRTAFIDSMPAAADCFSANRQGHFLCDLAGLARLVLTAQGVNSVTLDPHCSYRDTELLYSYRREAVTGRMASLIWIN